MRRFSTDLEKVLGILAISVLGSLLAAKAPAAPDVRSPKGIYVIYWPYSHVTPGSLTPPSDSGCQYSGPPSSPPTADENTINNTCALISNPAVSGLLVNVSWAYLAPPSGLTGSLTSGSACVTSMSSTAGLMVGMSMADATTAANIPPGTTIAGVPGTTACQVRMTTEATGSGAGDSLAVGTDDMQYLDDVFNTVLSYNDFHHLKADDPKFRTIQLGVFPGFASPSWFFTSAGVTSCDGLFTDPRLPAAHDCDFTNIFLATEGGTPIATPLPLPWSARYKAAWKSFLKVIATRYGSNPLLASVQVAGPTASSEEMILPNDTNNPGTLTLPAGVLEALQISSGNPDLTSASNVSALTAWNKLIKNHYGPNSSYVNTDQPFIDEWEAAIDLYGREFNRTTLSVSTGNGLPNYSGPDGTTGVGAFAIPPAFPGVCAPAAATTASSSDCVAEWTILQYFAQPGVGGFNGKSTQMDGLSGIIGTTFGPKMLSAATVNNAPLPETGFAQSSQMLAGLQEGRSPVTNPATAGCAHAWPSPLPAGCALSANGRIPLACAPIIPDTPPTSCLAPGLTTSDLSENPITIGSSLFVNPEDVLTSEQGLFNVLLITFMNTSAGGVFGAAPDPYFPYPTNSPLNYLQVWPADITYAEAIPSTSAPIATPPGASLPNPVTLQQELSIASEQLRRETAEAVLPPLPTPPPPPPPKKPPIPPPCPPGSGNCQL
jgi:hypothetical protein